MLKTVVLTLSVLAFAITTSQAQCTGDKDPGTGSKTELRYYYVPSSKTCYPFQYNGEGGNANNHLSEYACQCTCLNTNCDKVPPSKESCKLKLERGNCGLKVNMYFYNITSRKCELTVFGCQLTNGNHYKTYESCKTTCEDTAYPAGAKCTDPKNEGKYCPQTIPPRERWYYDMTANQCKKFIYLGCDGNQNRYTSWLDCENTCVQKTFSPHADCMVVKDEAGLCSNKSWVPRFYYNSVKKECQPFYFGQCKPANKNNFQTLKACQDICHPPGTCTGLPKYCSLNCIYGYKRDKNDCPLCECGPDPCVSVSAQCAAGQRCRVSVPQTCRNPPCSAQGVCVTYQDICNADPRSCTEKTSYSEARFVFNNVTKQCTRQFFHGCAGPNNFMTVANCEQVCKGVAIPSPNVCPDPVCNCVNNIGWTRDSNNCPVSCICPGTSTPTTSTCTSGTCSNGFTCVSGCSSYPACVTYSPKCVDRNMCMVLPTAAFGNCNRAPKTMYYYTNDGCKSFQWRGCSANSGVLFVSQSDCIRACGTNQCAAYSCAHCPGGSGYAVMRGNCPVCQCSSTPTPSTTCQSCNGGCNPGWTSYETGQIQNGCPVCSCRQTSTNTGNPTQVCQTPQCNCLPGQTVVKTVNPTTNCESCYCQPSCDCSQRVSCPLGQKGVLRVGSSAAQCTCECCATSCSCQGSVTYDNRGCAICNCLTNPGSCTRDASPCQNCAFGFTWEVKSGATCETCKCNNNPCDATRLSCSAGTKCRPKTQDNCVTNSCPATAVCQAPFAVCQLSSNSGNTGGACSGATPKTRFYYDRFRGGCFPFSFTGCGGNDNNFAREIDCMNFCRGTQ